MKSVARGGFGNASSVRVGASAKGSQWVVP